MAEPVTDARINQYLRTEKEVSTWIQDVLKERPDPSDLHDFLKDGTRLCKLMLEIDPSSIPHIHYTHHAFRLKENISFFLLACEDLRVPVYKLFTMSDLWEDGSIVAVVECLEELAIIVEAKGFAVKLNRIPEDTLLPNLSKEKKEHLRFLISKLKRPVIKAKPKRSAGIALMQIGYLAQINGIKMEKVIACLTRMQAVVRGRRVRNSIKKYARTQAFRQKLIREILTTEQTYLNGLRICEKLYIEPLQEMEIPLITDEQREGIFSNISDIIAYNSKFFGDLEPRVQRYFPNQRISDIFLSNNNFLEVYTPYVQNFDFSVALLACLSIRNPAFHKFICEKRERAESQGLDLSSFLITPIQRIPRYNLLLRDLIKYTSADESHPDLPGLQLALSQMEETGKEINKRKGDSEGILRVAYLASTIGKMPPNFTLLLPQRRIIKYGVMADTKQAVYLFTDVLLLVKAKRAVVTADVSPSCSLSVPPVPSSGQPQKVEEPLLAFSSAFWSYEIDHLSGSKNIELVTEKKKILAKLQFESPTEQEEWVTELNKWLSTAPRTGPVGITISRDETQNHSFGSPSGEDTDKKKWGLSFKGRNQNRMSASKMSPPFSTDSNFEEESREVTSSPEPETKKNQKKNEARKSWFGKKQPLELGTPTNFRHMNLKLDKQENRLFVDPENPVRPEDNEENKDEESVQTQKRESGRPSSMILSETTASPIITTTTTTMTTSTRSNGSKTPPNLEGTVSHEKPQPPFSQSPSSPPPSSPPPLPPRGANGKLPLPVIPPAHFKAVTNRPVSSPAGSILPARPAPPPRR
eukprot:TRINITY_DN15638_c0_g1_i1.p1 TRINITY_DN15638_c0_g1~~TRINITY_DN15638_c0_g1_i1.p1  ORF type:complete len:810 (+),score=149.18 TRINITY_DN15638_c0_g1_i1:75-2504(+)